MPKMLQELQFSVGSLRQDWGGKRFHDLLDGDGLLCQLIFGRTEMCEQAHLHAFPQQLAKPDETESPHPNRLKIRVPDRPSIAEPAGEHVMHLIPAGDLEGRSKDLCSHEFGHGKTCGDDSSCWE